MTGCLQQADGTASGVVFDIQRFCVDDGPGIRTVIFFKGCGLRCQWCHNPEGIGLRPELAVYSEQCLSDCALCLSTCPETALSKVEGRIAVDFDTCSHCLACVEVCPGEALRGVGQRYDTEKLLRACLDDRPFWEASGGGITLSGGEPVLQSSFLCDLLPRLESAAPGTHVLLETAGHYPFRLLEPLLPHIDHIFYDWKLPSSAAYLRYTGSDNRHVVANLKRLLALDFPLTVRMPMVPGINDTEEAMAQTTHALEELGVESLQLLEYNPLWEAKLPRLACGFPVIGANDEPA